MGTRGVPVEFIKSFWYAVLHDFAQNWAPDDVQLYREMAERGCARSRTSSRLAVNDSGDDNLRPCDERRRKTVRAFAGSLFNTQELESLVRFSTSGPSRPADVFKRGGLMKKVKLQPNFHCFSSY